MGPLWLFPHLKITDIIFRNRDLQSRDMIGLSPRPCLVVCERPPRPLSHTEHTEHTAWQQTTPRSSRCHRHKLPRKSAAIDGNHGRPAMRIDPWMDNLRGGLHRKPAGTHRAPTGDGCWQGASTETAAALCQVRSGQVRLGRSFCEARTRNPNVQLYGT